jgi:hypothetical protein
MREVAKMATSFLDALQKNTSKNARTENGAVTHSATGSDVLNFYALAGAMRDNVKQAKQLFRKALNEDRQLAIRALFYLRDIRGGQGERDLFRELYRELDADTAGKVAAFIPEYGRWDDLFSVPNVPAIVEIVSRQLRVDNTNLEDGKSVSLMAKWLPSENASSKVSRAQARELAAALGLSNKEYRQQVVRLRKHIGLLEQAMSEGNWDGIDYSKLPSQASRKHSKAFNRHDNDRFSAFLDAVIKGEAKMNAGTTYTYEVVDMIRKGQTKAADAMWSALPDYTNGANALVVADVSGSMGSVSYGGGPIDVSVSLALYFAERNKGPFNGYFMTFSERPELVKVSGATLSDKMRNIGMANWGMNTNIQAVFDVILKAAKAAGADATDVPKIVYIVSDMEFDRSTRNSDKTAFENAKKQFEKAGYVLPHIVFWNVNARNTNVPVTKNEGNVTLVSGLSQSTFAQVVQGKTPYESMIDVLNGPRYAQILV